MEQKNESTKDKSSNLNSNKTSVGSPGQPSHGGSGVPDNSRDKGHDNELDSNGNPRGKGDRTSSPAQERGSSGGGTK